MHPTESKQAICYLPLDMFIKIQKKYLCKINFSIIILKFFFPFHCSYEFSKCKIFYVWRFMFYLLIYLTKRKIGAENERDLLFSDSLSKHLQQPRLDQDKARSQNSVWISHVGSRDPSNWILICWLPGALAGSQIRRGGGTWS